MANGKKNYFRHSFFARNDIKLLKLKDEIGVGFYFYYFSLLELCGEESSDILKNEYEFHDSTIRSLWGVNLKKSERIACVMNAVGLLQFKKLEKSFWFSIPNLSKYLGRYTNKNESNKPNKRKENKSKLNKTNGDDILQIYREVGGGGHEKAKELLGIETYEKVIGKSGWNSLGQIDEKFFAYTINKRLKES